MRILILLLTLLATPLAAASWSIVPSDTKVEVDVGYLGNTVTLHFDNIAGRIDFDEKRPDRARAAIAVGTRSVETGLGLVNDFVKSKPYLDAATFPQINFTLDRLVQTTKSTADIFGTMTFRGVTRPVTFKAQVFRYGPSPGAPDRFDAGFTLTGTVDRREFGQTAGLPQVAPELPVRIRLLLRSDT